jgi:hypothetical protein
MAKTSQTVDAGKGLSVYSGSQTRLFGSADGFRSIEVVSAAIEKRS